MKEFKVGDKVEVFNRYLFAVPVKGVVVKIADNDRALSVFFNPDNIENVRKYSYTYFFREECRHVNPIYDIEKFMDGIALAISFDNSIKELNVSVDFYEALKNHVRKTFPPQANLHGEGTLNIYGILITKGDVE